MAKKLSNLFSYCCGKNRQKKNTHQEKTMKSFDFIQNETYLLAILPFNAFIYATKRNTIKPQTKLPFLLKKPSKQGFIKL